MTNEEIDYAIAMARVNIIPGKLLDDVIAELEKERS